MKMSFEMRKNLITFFPKLHVAKCGHRTRFYDLINQDTFLKLIPKTKGDKVEYCHKCLSEMSAPCAWCGLDIDVGDFVTLYSLKNMSIEEAEQKVQKGSICYDRENLRYVGCVRRSCTITGADYQGILYPNHHIHRILSPIEMALNSEKPILIHNE